MKDGTYQYYAGNMVYKKVIANNIATYPLNYLLFDEGLVTKSSGGYSYEYHLKDHLGNTRVAFQPNGSGGTNTTQVVEYYPFGSSYLPLSPAGTNKYLYNGKEKQDDVLNGTALDWYDYGARFYDPMIGRFHSVDPLSEKYNFQTPYAYASNNPILFIDYMGMGSDSTNKSPSTIQPLVSHNVGPISELAIGLITPLGEGINTLVSGYNPDNQNASALDYVTACVKIIAFGLNTAIGGEEVPVGEMPILEPSPNLSNIGVKLQDAADLAVANAGEGSGHVYGTKAHKEFSNINIEGTTPEVSYKDGQVVPYGTKGSVRIDRVVGDINNPSAIYDLKTGNALVSKRDVTRVASQVPNKLILQQLKPTKL